MSKLKTPLRWLLSAMMIFAGIMHFVSTDSFANIVPPMFGDRRLLVQVSGFAEIGLGLGLALPALRRLSAWGLIALYIAVYPANIYMAVKDIPVDGQHFQLLEWLRLPLQFVLIGWAWWYTRLD
jgi:uncharacterized membrane protein